MEDSSASTRGQVGHIAHPHYLADLLVGVACADGKLDIAEANTIAQLMRTAVKAKLDMHVIRDLVRESKERIAADGIDAVLVVAGRQLAAAGQLELALGMAIDVAEASYGINEQERQTLHLCALGGGIKPSEVDHLIARTRGETDSLSNH